MKSYECMEINNHTFASCPVIIARSPSNAIYKAFGVIAKRSSDFMLDYRTVCIENGRKTYLKRITNKGGCKHDL